MKLVFVIAAIFIIGTNAGSPSFTPMSSSIPSIAPPQSCADIKSLIEQLSADIRELLKQQVLLHPRLLDLNDIANGNFLLNILSNILSGNEILTFDNILLHSILSPNIVIGKTDFGFDINSTWGCLIDIFSA
ncbi:unnamed protein product [Chironomus riparius]|uniref:Uncharacterized protein n=1 Tax=Chironomus riparius TaxID=315576 RepID=A0A9N9WZC6_9DIPT|nr:unnamed protein product [Chironomus riparius]